jgi:hypothetical protein
MPSVITMSFTLRSSANLPKKDYAST